MWQVIKKYPLAVAAAVLVHVLFVLLMMVTINWSSDPPAAGNNKEIEVIQAQAVAEQEIEARLERLREAERKQREAEQARQRERERQAERQRQAALEKKREEQERKRKAEEQRKAELKKKQEAERKQQEEAERKRKQEQAQKQREEEQRRRQEQDLQARLDEEARQREAQLAASEKAINKYRRQIKQQVTRNWKIPSSAQTGMTCEIMVRLLPSGDVVSVQIVKSSGDPTFDRSVENAVYSAAPLPVPSVESGLFDEFREVKFTFDPKSRL